MKRAVVFGGRVDVVWPCWLGNVCFLGFSCLSVSRVPQYLTIQRASTPLTEPCLRISRTRLFSQSRSTATVYIDYALFADAAKDNVPDRHSTVPSCTTCGRCDD